jgi:hypothetical protein
MRKSKIFLRVTFLSLLLGLFFFTQFSWALSDEEIRNDQAFLSKQTGGERVAFWAGKFVGVPYDRDPQGLYVTRAAIVADDAVDCMYLTFRSVELALSQNPEEAVQIALDKRFHTRGILLNGDILFFFKAPEKRAVEEGVGHMGIVKVEGKDSERKIFLIHAGGTKNSGGAVKKVLLADYLAAMPFVGVKVTRFE